MLPFLSCWIAREELGLGDCCGNRQLCVLLLGEAWLGAGQKAKERLGWTPRAEKGRGFTGDEVSGSNNLIKNRMSFPFKGEGGRSNCDGNVSAGKGDVWSVAMGQMEHPRGMTTRPNTDHSSCVC